MRGLAARSDEKPLRTESSNSGLVSGLSESQLPRGYPVATVHQHGVSDSGVLVTRDLPNERHRKVGQSEHTHREGHEIMAGSMKPSATVGDVEKNTAGL